jgi:hypothetical protein
MSNAVALALLAQGNTGTELLSLLDAIVSDIEQENINDFVQHAVAMNMPTLEEVAF